jgi:hypothetical protein
MRRRRHSPQIPVTPTQNEPGRSWPGDPAGQRRSRRTPLRDAARERRYAMPSVKELTDGRAEPADDDTW